MREQVIAPKVGSRGGMSNKRAAVMQQRPARRSGRESNATLTERLRSAARFLPFFGKIAVVIILGVLVFAGYRAAASATFFQVRQIEVKGTSRSSADQVQQVIRRELTNRGVWRADLSAVSAQLEHLPWVRTAVVSRLLPDGIRVRITERVQRAVVRTNAGRLVWVDDDAVVLGEMTSADQMPTFFLRGLSEENSDAARLDNQERVQKFLELQKEWDAAGLSERVSEVNLIDVRDIRAQLAGNDSQIEVRLGSKDAGVRLKKALNVLDEQRESPRGGLISYVDLSQGKRAVVGFTSGRQLSDADQSNGEAEPVPAAAAQSSPVKPAPKPPARDARAAKPTIEAGNVNKKRN
ncbi:MAG TPA: FtsQ-type POTRA domain-containing protein [Pyrinomonadaceae bacterium]|nr:FtsQ-type POTRA domain-containing protein [Pyrinomonadaceae bacterium]